VKGKTTPTGTSDSPNKDSYWWDRYWSSTDDETDQDSIFKTVQEMFESIKVSASAIRIATGFDMVGYTAGGFVSIFMAQVVAFMMKTALTPTAGVANAGSNVYQQRTNF
jgi:fatty-acid desaturase